MTKKDYIAIARAINIERDGWLDADASNNDRTVGRLALNCLSVRLADVMQSDNPLFDRARFLAACGVQS